MIHDSTPHLRGHFLLLLGNRKCPRCKIFPAKLPQREHFLSRPQAAFLHKHTSGAKFGLSVTLAPPT